MYKKMLIMFAVALGTIVVGLNQKDDSDGMSSLMIENVEALAGGETGNGFCYGTGSVPCPYAPVKVLWVTERSVH